MRKTKILWLTVLAVIIAFTMAATVFMAIGFAEDAPENGYVLIDENLGVTPGVDNVALYYNASTKTAKISGEGRIRNFSEENAYFEKNNAVLKDAENVIIENGVTNISENLFYSSKLKRAVIPDSVTEIGASAFKNSEDLDPLTLPETLISIGNDAFSGCDSLKSLTIPETVTSIGSDAFSSCDSLRSLTLPGCSFNPYTIRYCSSLEEVTIGEGATAIPANMFENLPIKKIVLPNSLQTIGHDAFKNCANLKTVTMPSATGKIACFSGCTALEEITLPEGVTALGDKYDYDFLFIHQHEVYYAFKDCVNLKRVTLPSTLTEIREDSFSGCPALEEFVVASGSTANIPQNCFAGCTALSTVVLPDKATRIGYAAFSGCTGLSEITIPESIDNIQPWLFQDCTALTKVTLPSGLTSINTDAFSGCANLTQVGFGTEDTPVDGKIVFPSGLKEIGIRTFSGCVRITALSFPQSVTSIGWYAFSGCDDLEEIRFCRNEMTVGPDAFPVLHGATIYTCYDNETSWNIKTDDGSVFSGDYTVIGSAHEIVFVPEEKPTTTSAGMNAHYECTRCGATFTDAQGNDEVPPQSLVIPKINNFFTRLRDFFEKIIKFIRRLFGKE